jgi:hypothetical protein
MNINVGSTPTAATNSTKRQVGGKLITIFRSTTQAWVRHLQENRTTVRDVQRHELA